MPRHEFVPPKLASDAYFNRPLPIGYGQTVSPTYLIALNTELADITTGDDVLLLGIGGGYHAAVLAELAGGKRLIDIQPRVATVAMNRLFRLGYNQNVRLANHDLYFGWHADQTKFDAIIVRQSTDLIPDALVR